MATWQRMAVLFATTIAVAVAAVIYYRVGVAHLFPMATGASSGPFSSVIGTLDVLVPITLAIIELGVAVWAISGGVQQERARMRGPR
jgi:hypothetical protein